MSPTQADTQHVARCDQCRYRLASRRALELSFAGMNAFGSAYGASIAASRLCTLHQCWVSPQDSCSRYAPIGAPSDA